MREILVGDPAEATRCSFSECRAGQTEQMAPRVGSIRCDGRWGRDNSESKERLTYVVVLEAAGVQVVGYRSEAESTAPVRFWDRVEMEEMVEHGKSALQRVIAI
jgi:hypothetical protein